MTDKTFMKIQKYISTLAIVMISLSLGCSTHPEIKPYQADNQELTVEEPRTSADTVELPEVDDGFVEDADLSADEEKSEVAVNEKAPTPLPKIEQEAPKEVVKKEAKTRTPASALKNGFFVFADNCDMKASPKNSSKSVGNVSKGKKLWLDVHNSSWLKAYKKSGTVFVSSDCVK